MLKIFLLFLFFHHKTNQLKLRKLQNNIYIFSQISNIPATDGNR